MSQSVKVLFVIGFNIIRKFNLISFFKGFPERQKFGEPSIREQQQQLVTPLEKQQQYGVLHQQEQSLQSGKVPVQPQLTTQLAQEQQQTRA